MEPTEISAVVITFNEEKNIRRCITSLMGVADEILVVDSFSSDQTVAICRELQVRVIQQAFLGYIEQKNFAMQQARFDYVLSLDADEALSEALRNNILKEKKSMDYDAYRFNRLNNFYGKWLRYGKWYPDTKTRLWNRHKACWGGVNPHDRVVLHPDLSVKRLPGDLLHFAYEEVKDHFDQMVHFSAIAARSAHQKGKKSNLFFIIFSPVFKFIKRYVFKLGFLDGYYGLIACLNSAVLNYFKYVNLLELQKKDAGKR
ncbi:MAG: glycosyltransferase family 2 protein [Candidatus Cyclobacteriaceae bacterium M3_2C_046]